MPLPSLPFLFLPPTHFFLIWLHRGAGGPPTHPSRKDLLNLPPLLPPNPPHVTLLRSAVFHPNTHTQTHTLHCHQRTLCYSGSGRLCAEALAQLHLILVSLFLGQTGNPREASLNLTQQQSHSFAHKSTALRILGVWGRLCRALVAMVTRSFVGRNKGTNEGVSFVLPQLFNFVIKPLRVAFSIVHSKEHT